MLPPAEPPAQPREPHDLRIRQRWLLLPIQVDRLYLRPAGRQGVDELGIGMIDDVVEVEAVAPGEGAASEALRSVFAFARDRSDEGGAVLENKAGYPMFKAMRGNQAFATGLARAFGGAIILPYMTASPTERLVALAQPPAKAAAIMLAEAPSR